MKLRYIILLACAAIPLASSCSENKKNEADNVKADNLSELVKLRHKKSDLYSTLRQETTLSRESARDIKSRIRDLERSRDLEKSRLERDFSTEIYKVADADIHKLFLKKIGI